MWACASLSVSDYVSSSRWYERSWLRSDRYQRVGDSTAGYDNTTYLSLSLLSFLRRLPGLGWRRNPWEFHERMFNTTMMDWPTVRQNKAGSLTSPHISPSTATFSREVKSSNVSQYPNWCYRCREDPMTLCLSWSPHHVFYLAQYLLDLLAVVTVGQGCSSCQRSHMIQHPSTPPHSTVHTLCSMYKHDTHDVDITVTRCRYLYYTFRLISFKNFLYFAKLG